MASALLAAQRRAVLAAKMHFLPPVRLFATQAPSPANPSSSSSSSSTPSSTTAEPNTHFRITSRRSAISLPAHIKGTLVSLGIHRRMQTVYHRHTPETAGKILAVKELVEVENVPASAVRDKTEQRRERKVPRGFVVVRSKLNSLA